MSIKCINKQNLSKFGPEDKIVDKCVRILIDFQKMFFIFMKFQVIGGASTCVGRDGQYDGQISSTGSGKRCMRWNALWPHYSGPSLLVCSTLALQRLWRVIAICWTFQNSFSKIIISVEIRTMILGVPGATRWIFMSRRSIATFLAAKMTVVRVFKLVLSFRISRHGIRKANFKFALT